MSEHPLFNGFDIRPARLSCLPLFSGGDGHPLKFYYKDETLALELWDYYADFGGQQKQLLADYLSEFCTDHQVNEFCVFLRWDETGHCSECLEILYDIAQSLGILGIDHTLRIYVSTDMIDHCRPDSRFSFRSLPYFLLISWLQHWNTNFEWNPSTNQALYLPGKFTKSDRLHLLNKITENSRYQDLIEFTIIARNATENSAEISCIDSEMIGYDPDWQGVEQWTLAHTHDIDLTQQVEPNDFAYALLPIDALTKKSLLLVTESWHQCPDFITEKTFNAICLGMPFIIYNDDFALELQHMGFVTYQELLDNNWKQSIDHHSTYDLAYYDYHSNLMLQRVEKFLTRCRHDSDFVVQVQEVIAHNKQRAREIVLAYRDEYNSHIGLVFNHILEQQPPAILRQP